MKKRNWTQGFFALRAHRVLLADAARVRAYDRAIRRRVKGRRVLDVGAGTGLLSLLAARAGAAHVHAVEKTAIARAARRVAQDNGLAGRVTFTQKNFLRWRPPAKCDVLLHEHVGEFIWNENMVALTA